MYTEEEMLRARLVEMNKQIAIMSKTLINVVDNYKELESRVETLEMELVKDSA